MFQFFDDWLKSVASCQVSPGDWHTITRGQHIRVLWIAIVVAVSWPGARAQTTTVDPAGKNTGTIDNSLQFGGAQTVLHFLPPGPPTQEPTGTAIGSNRTTPSRVPGKGRKAVNSYGLDFYTDGKARMSITQSGRVGIGTDGPGSPLEIDAVGDATLALYSTDGNGGMWSFRSKTGSTDASSGGFQIFDVKANSPRIAIDKYGMVSVATLQITGGADIAEPFISSHGALPPGAVVVIDEQQTGEVRISDRAYDSKVAGVISGAGGISPAIRMRQAENVGEESVALTGRVFALADATAESIHPGDLLTTSPVLGHCMKATDAERARGAILGKAMSSLESGHGLVLVLVTLE